MPIAIIVKKKKKSVIVEVQSKLGFFFHSSFVRFIVQKIKNEHQELL